MSCPKISIVTPSYNQGEFLEDCINSILDQGYEDFEYIIIDGGSTDNSIDIIKKYEKHLSYWCSEPDNGQSDAINKGFRRTTGELVAWLNSDDFYLPGAFMNVAKAYLESPSASFYYGNGHRVAEDGNIKSEFYPQGTVCFDLQSFVFGLNYILQPATFINRKILDQISLGRDRAFHGETKNDVNSYIDSSLHWGMDTDLWIRLAQKAHPFPLINCLAASREYGETKTSIGSFKRVEELRQIAELYSGQPYTPGVLLYFLDTLHRFASNEETLFPLEFRRDLEMFWSESAKLMTSMGTGPDGLPIKTLMPPVFSIITPSFNQGRFIERTIQSVLSQGVPVEYCVVDGGSSDETLDILKKYGDHLRWISEKDDGQASALNKGIRATSSEIIGWLNSDDIYYPGALTAVKEFFDSHPDIDIVYGNANHIDEKDKVIEPYYTEEWDYQRLKDICFICQPAVFFRRRVIEQIGPFDDKLQYCMDYEYWLRLGKLTDFVRLDRTLAGSRMYDDNKTLGARVAVHLEINEMFKERFGMIPDKWIFAFAYVSVEQRGYNRSLPAENIKFILSLILLTLASFVRWRQIVSLSTVKKAARWLKVLVESKLVRCK